jgi:hypothetical protein
VLVSRVLAWAAYEEELTVPLRNKTPLASQILLLEVLVDAMLDVGDNGVPIAEARVGYAERLYLEPSHFKYPVLLEARSCTIAPDWFMSPQYTDEPLDNRVWPDVPIVPFATMPAVEDIVKFAETVVLLDKL